MHSCTNNDHAKRMEPITSKIFVTGAAGFIGFHLTKQLLEEGHEVVGFDILNTYYDKKLKLDRLTMVVSVPAEIISANL